MAKSKTLSQVVSNTGPLSDGTISTSDVTGLDTAYQQTLVSGTNIKTVNGSSLLGSGDVSIGVSTFNTRTGAVTLSSSDVTTALGYTPYNSTNPSGYITSSASITGNAATATALQTARTINGVSFDGSANITVADSTKLPLAGGTMTGAITFAAGQTWPTFNQSTTGNAATATTATYANNITQGFNSNWNTDFQAAPAGSTILRGDTSTGSSTGGPGGTWWFQQNMRHTNASNFWGVQVAWGWEDNANILRTRNVTGGNYGSWVTYLNSNNYNSYSPTLTGGGASGTWGISITGDVNKTQGTFGYSGSGLNIDVGGQGGPQVLGQGNGAAMMTFHRPGAYAINFGLGTDNQLRTGGWSRGGNYIVVDTGNYNSAINRGYFNRESNGGTMVSGQTYSIYTGGGAVGMYLPTAANSAQGDRIVILNLSLKWATNPFYVYMNTNTRLMNLNETMTCDINVGSIVLTCVYHDGTAYWNVAPGG